MKSDELDLQRENVDLYFKRTGLAAGAEARANAALRDELKKIQRVFRLAPHYSTTNALLARGITSARDITAIGKARFMREVAPAAGIGTIEADAMYRKAETTATAAMMLAGELQDIALAAPIAAVNSGGLTAALDQAKADFPNLKSLFKGVDTCACEHCRSVYGPAAYLVELLEFIDKRSVTDLTVSPPVTTTAAQDVLFARRPDLGDIDLSCENAHTPVPYIDLVNELLEAQVAPDAGIGYSGPLAAGADPLSGTIAPALLTRSGRRRHSGHRRRTGVCHRGRHWIVCCAAAFHPRQTGRRQGGPDWCERIHPVPPAPDPDAGRRARRCTGLRQPGRLHDPGQRIVRLRTAVRPAAHGSAGLFRPPGYRSRRTHAQFAGGRHAHRRGHCRGNAGLECVATRPGHDARRGRAERLLAFAAGRPEACRHLPR